MRHKDGDCSRNLFIVALISIETAFSFRIELLGKPKSKANEKKKKKIILIKINAKGGKKVPLYILFGAEVTSS